MEIAAKVRQVYSLQNCVYSQFCVLGWLLPFSSDWEMYQVELKALINIEWWFLSITTSYSSFNPGCEIFFTNSRPTSKVSLYKKLIKIICQYSFKYHMRKYFGKVCLEWCLIHSRFPCYCFYSLTYFYSNPFIVILLVNYKRYKNKISCACSVLCFSFNFLYSRSLFLKAFLRPLVNYGVFLYNIKYKKTCVFLYSLIGQCLLYNELNMSIYFMPYLHFFHYKFHTILNAINSFLKTFIPSSPNMLLFWVYIPIYTLVNYCHMK